MEQRDEYKKKLLNVFDVLHEKVINTKEPESKTELISYMMQIYKTVFC